MRYLIILILLALFSSPVISSDSQLAREYGFAYQAGSMCDGLMNNRATERALDSKVGGSIRDMPEFMTGLNDAASGWPDSCQEASRRFGCQGTQTAMLVQERNMHCPFR